MATNLRLRPDAEAALQERARSTGRSQQAVIREALDLHLGLTPRSQLERVLADRVEGLVAVAPRHPYRRATRRIELPAGIGSSDLLDRSERL